MKGFTDKAIIILPRFGTYNSRPDEWKRLLRASIINLVKYLKLDGIDSYTFNTDDITDLLGVKELKQLEVLTKEDRLFIETFYLDGKKAPVGESIDENIFKEVRKKYPVKRGTEKAEKLEIFEKRDKWICNKIISESKLVITCEVKSSSYYKAISKAGDERIVAHISPLNFSIEASLSGTPVDVIDIFNYNKAYSPLHMWEV